MRKLKITSLLLGFLASQSALGFGAGWSSYPLLTDKKFISTEFTGVTSDGGGVGVQARYTQKLNKLTTVDAGIGMAGGERTSRIFVGMDYELYPDYMKQPKVSVKTTIENAEEFDVRFTSLTVAPTASKGFNFWGKEAFPYASLPVGLKLDTISSTYSTTVSANVGVTGNLPIDGYKHLTAKAEAFVGLKNTFSGMIVGLSFPMD